MIGLRLCLLGAGEVLPYLQRVPITGLAKLQSRLVVRKTILCQAKQDGPRGFLVSSWPYGLSSVQFKCQHLKTHLFLGNKTGYRLGPGKSSITHECN